MRDSNRINIYLYKPQRKIVESLLEKHDGNVSAAIRDFIDFASFCIENAGSLDRAKERLIDQQSNIFKPGDKLLLNIEGITSLTFRTKKNSDGDNLELSINGEIHS
jgi:hypothetical protein